MLPYIYFALAGLLRPQGNPAAPPEALKSAMNALETRHFNGFLYVEQDGKEIFFHSVGWADRESKRPFTRDTGVEIGSIVKPMSKIALLKLVAAGRIALDDPISKYFSGVPEDKKAITVRLLMEHRSGFKDIFGDDYEPMERDELMKKMLASKLDYAPDSKNQYSNSGYSMLAAIIEKVTGESFEQHLARSVFRPIGLKRTGYVLPGWKPDELMVGYKRDGTRWGSPLDKFWYKDGPAWNLRGNGGMISTMPELARWVLAAHTGKLLDAASYRVFSPALAAPDVKPNAFWGVAGGNGIFDTVVAYNPSRRLVIVTASTAARFEIESALRDLRPLIYSLVDKPSK